MVGEDVHSPHEIEVTVDVTYDVCQCNINQRVRTTGQLAWVFEGVETSTQPTSMILIVESTGGRV